MLKRITYFSVPALLFLFGVSRLMYEGQTRVESAASYALFPFLLLQNKIAELFHIPPKNVVQELERSLLKREALQKELIELKALLGYQEETREQAQFLARYRTQEKIIAQILLRRTDKSHYYIIDKGSNEGISQSMVALYKECILGRVVQVYPHYSKIQLITDPACKIAAICANSKVKGIHEGCKSADLTLLTFVQPSEPLQIDDLLLSSGEGGFYPAGFGLGRIKSFEQDGYLFRVSVQPLLDFKAIKYCCLVSHTVALTEEAV